MPAKLGQLLVGEIVTTRINIQDFEALSLAVEKSKTNRTDFLRRMIREHLATKAETPVA